MLTNVAVRSARPKPRAYKLADGQGLHLFVAPSGLKSFRLRFRLGGREQLLSIGQFPDIDLAAAREAAQLARDALRAGRDPRDARAARARAADQTFAAIARAWHAHHRSRWTETHAADVLVSIERDVLPAIGAIDVCDVTPPMVLEVLHAVEARGAVETARRLRQRISAVFGHAVSIGVQCDDPATIVRRALAATPVRGQQLALVSIDECRELLAASAGGAAIVVLASRFLALTGVRLAAVRGMRWDEVEGADWDGDFVGPPAATWRVPAARMKLAAAKKGDARFDHVVPLSRQAVEILRAARAITGPDGLVFTGRGETSPIGEKAIGDLYGRAGYAGRHVPHGWRSSFATILNERHPEYRFAIDRALAHAPKDKVEAAYNRSQQIGRRRWLLQIWADLIAPDAMAVRRG